MSSGNVYLVGAGPGDPGLLTLRGLRCLQSATVVVYDALVNPVLLAHAPGAEHIYAGKQADRHSLPQREIQQILIDFARRGHTVVRLKGGDPFVFGRGGEEALALADAGIPFEIVPGITAGIAAPAYAGIPVTQRGLSASVTFVTGHFAGDERDLPIDFSRLNPAGTTIFYMGVAAMPRIFRELAQHGWSEDTPCAIIEWATYARQRTVRGTLASLPQAAADGGIGAPSLIVVGAVTALREDLAWFESRPLFGLRVALTHAEQRKGPLEQQLAALGADVFSFPTLEVAPENTPDALRHLEDYDWVVLTSANAAEMLFSALDALGADARALAGIRLCAVGASTLDTLSARFLRPDVVPDNYTSEAIVEAMNRFAPLDQTHVLLPRADIARASLARVLQEAGATVTEAVAYHTRVPVDSGARVDALLKFQPQVLVFTNAAAVRNLCALLAPPTLRTLQDQIASASIGPVTSRALDAAGFTVNIEPARHDVVHLVEAITDWWRARGGAVEAASPHRPISETAGTTETTE
jgi:uroporphyrinogen III methyltransferase/synthase